MSKSLKPLIRISTLVASLFLCLLLSHCSGGDSHPLPVIQDESLVGYLNRFAREAQERGIAIDFSNTEAVFVNSIRINGQAFCGRGYPDFEGTGRQRIEISRETGCWAGLEDVLKENLFFHEIGHAYFSRSHTEERLSNGFIKSMMCSSSCNNFFTYTRATSHRRSYYIDELLDENTPEPDWGKLKNNFNAYWGDEISERSTLQFNSGSSAIEGSIDNTGKVNGTYSLKMKAASRDTENFATWSLSFEQPTIPQSASLKLSATVTSVGPVLGKGLGLAISTNDGLRQIQLASTEADQTFNGIMDKRVLEVNLIDYLTVGESIVIFLIWRSDTSGEVYFDDIKLEVAEN